MLHGRADFVSYISHRDRAAVYGDTRIPNNVGVIPNGVYLEDDKPLELSLPSQLYASNGYDASIVFLGNMGYAPNIDAALRLAAVLPRVQAQYPTATLSIVGRNPVPEIMALTRQSGVRVTGEVPSIWPHLRNARVCCFPMAQGAGLQNKVLESLWSGRPLVTTSVGNSGVQGTDRQNLLVADHEDALVEALVYLLRNPEEANKLGQSGRAFVEQNFAWTKILSDVRREFLGQVHDENAQANGPLS